MLYLAVAFLLAVLLFILVIIFMLGREIRNINREIWDLRQLRGDLDSQYVRRLQELDDELKGLLE